MLEAHNCNWQCYSHVVYCAHSVRIAILVIRRRTQRWHTKCPQNACLDNDMQQRLFSFDSMIICTNEEEEEEIPNCQLLSIALIEWGKTAAWRKKQTKCASQSSECTSTINNWIGIMGDVHNCWKFRKLPYTNCCYQTNWLMTHNQRSCD